MFRLVGVALLLATNSACWDSKSGAGEAADAGDANKEPDPRRDEYSAKVERCRRLEPIAGLERLTTCTVEQNFCAIDGRNELCPQSFAEAVSLACYAGHDRYTTYCNDCGGLTISTNEHGAGALVHLDGEGQFVGTTSIIQTSGAGVSVKDCPAVKPLIITFGLHCDAIETLPDHDTYVPCSKGSAGKPPFRR